jgi:hypothetical protein
MGALDATALIAHPTRDRSYYEIELNEAAPINSPKSAKNVI